MSLKIIYQEKQLKRMEQRTGKRIERGIVFLFLFKEMFGKDSHIGNGKGNSRKSNLKI